MGTYVSNTVFSNCFRVGRVSFPVLQETPAILKQRLTGQAPSERELRKTRPAYNNELWMGSLTAKCVQLGPWSSSYKPTMTMEAPMFHYIEALVLPDGLRTSFISVYIHGTDFAEQTRIRSEISTVLRQQLLEHFPVLLIEGNSYVRTLQSLREWAVAEKAPDEYRMVIQSDELPT